MSAPQEASGPGASSDAWAVVKNLQVRLAGTRANVVDDISFEVRSGELLGLVGESGSGKTTAALTLLGHTRRGLEVGSGSVSLGGVDVLRAPRRQLQQMRGSEVAYVPQDPTSALNPAVKIGTQLLEVSRAHPAAAKTQGDPKVRLRETLDEVGLGSVPNLLAAYPHQLSGGQQQRVALAMAFLLRPKVIVLDEPTTGLDVTTQRRVLDTVRDLCKSHGVAAIYVSHDLAVVRGLVDSLLVLYAGQVVEYGTVDEVFSSPSHPYTQKLLRAVPALDKLETLEGIAGQPPRPGHRPPGCQFAARCPLQIPACTKAPVPLIPVERGHVARCIRLDVAEIPDNRKALAPKHGLDRAGDLLRVSGLSARYGSKQILDNVDLAVPKTQCVAVVGESGSGKTTLARCLVGLHKSWSGEVSLDGEPLPRLARQRPAQALQDIQYVFQNPYTSLNPRQTIGRILDQPLQRFYPTLTRSDRDARITNVLKDVALSPDFWSRYPDELSGGERQRVAIARALVIDPMLLVCDEVTSALDVSVQATIVELLRSLRDRRGLSLVFITHNLALVRSIAEKVVVMANGRVVEAGPVADIFERPQHPYTISLMEDAPTLSNQTHPSGSPGPAIDRAGERSASGEAR